MKKFRSLLVLLVMVSSTLSAQEIPEQYLAEALGSNLVLKEKNINYEKSLIALKQARSLFLPETWIEGQYSVAKGGRSLDLPIGDLLNPVYQTLNQLTGSNHFPTINNTSEQFLPNNFYDLRLRTTLPIINPALKINRNIQQDQVSLQQTEIDIYKRELIREVKVGYYKYLMAKHSIGIYENALMVVNQNLKVNQSLLSNGKGLPAYVSRAASEVTKVESDLLAARNEEQNAKAYFNFLLNKPLTDPIIAIEISLTENVKAIAANLNDNINGREELKSIGIAKNINKDVQKLNRSFRTPKVNAFLDLASQGFDFQVNRNSFFYLGGIQMQVPLFAGKRNIYKIEQSELDGKNLELKNDYLRQQLELSASVSRNNAATIYANYNSAIKQEEAARKYFTLIDRGYREGVNTYIEFLDARNQLTSAQLQLNINKYKVLAALADYERQTASYSFK